MVITTKKHCLSEAREEMMLRKMLPSAENAKCVEIRAHFVSSFLVLHGRKKTILCKNFKTSNVFLQALVQFILRLSPPYQQCLEKPSH